MRIAIAQLNPIVGDVSGNARMMLEEIEVARAAGADLLVTSELALIGYPPRDLLFRDGVVEACERAVQAIAAAAGPMTVLIGHPRRVAGGVRPFRNSVSVGQGGAVVAVYDKRLLPGYDVFDEDRYFDPGSDCCVVEIAGRRVGIVVCEDLWRAEDVSAERRYDAEPVAETVAAGADVLISLNASPFVIGKWSRHVEQLTTLARAHGVEIVSVNQVGGNDDLVFDGRAVVVNAAGELTHRLPGWTAGTEIVELAVTATSNGQAPAAIAPEVMAELWPTLVLGLRDYVRKTAHTDVLLGLSGGIDSALVATIAAAAVGPAHVRGVLMPSRYSSAGSITDARDLAERLGLLTPDEVSIEAGHATVAEAITPALSQAPDGLADENIQARLRGLYLMAISNATGSLVLATSNKSELAVGYSTLYGDMCGAMAPIGDLLKTQVYDLSRWINEHHADLGFERAPIPEASITKPPSAELRPDQTDQDSLPPYDILDEVIERFIDREQSVETIIAETGWTEAAVRGYTAMIDRNEFKRHQASVILKVAPRTFGRGRVMPIVGRDSSGRLGPEKKFDGPDAEGAGDASFAFAAAGVEIATLGLSYEAYREQLEELSRQYADERRLSPDERARLDRAVVRRLFTRAADGDHPLPTPDGEAERLLDDLKNRGFEHWYDEYLVTAIFCRSIEQHDPARALRIMNPWLERLKADDRRESTPLTRQELKWTRKHVAELRRLVQERDQVG